MQKLNDKEKILCCFLIAFLNVIFLAIPKEDMMVLGNGDKIPTQSFVWFLMEFTGYIVFFFILYKESTQYPFAFLVLVALKVCDVADFYLTHNQIWMVIRKIPISMNTVTVAAIGFMIIGIIVRETINDLEYES